MGKVIVKFNDGHLESFKCKSKERAAIIVSKRLKVKEWDYYGNNEPIFQTKKKKVENKPVIPMIIEELKIIMRQQGLM